MRGQNSERTRRRVLAATGSGLALGIAGCTRLFGESDTTGTERATTTGTQTPTNSATATDTATESATETDSPTETEEPGPGYKHDHWHGRLFFEVNGELVNFDQPKYYLHNIDDENPDTVYFHFHEDEDAHGPNEWSNEKRIITLQRGLNLLPGIGYERRSGAHVVTYDGTTYDGGRSGTTISIKQGDTPINPAEYQVQHDDNYYVQVVTGDTKRTATPAHEGADLATLLFGLNNIRVDFSRERYLGPEAGSEAFHFHDDGHPSMCYIEGAVTVADALNSLPGIGYAQESGNHVVEYRDEERPTYSRTYDGSVPEHEITIQERTRPIDPTTHELAAGDIIWLHIQSQFLPSNEH